MDLVKETQQDLLKARNMGTNKNLGNRDQSKNPNPQQSLPQSLPQSRQPSRPSSPRGPSRVPSMQQRRSGKSPKKISKRN